MLLHYSALALIDSSSRYSCLYLFKLRFCHRCNHLKTQELWRPLSPFPLIYLITASFSSVFHFLCSIIVSRRPFSILQLIHVYHYKMILPHHLKCRQEFYQCSLNHFKIVIFIIYAVIWIMISATSNLP